MKLLKTFCIAMLAIAAVGIMTAASASASLPSLLFLPGAEEGELTAESTTAKTEFFGIVNLKGEGYKFVFSGKEMSDLGPIDLDFYNVKLGSTVCSQTGEPNAGEILITIGEWHAVLAPGGVLRIDVLIGETGFSCGTTKIKVRGSSLSTLSNFGEEPTSFTGTNLCSSTGTPEFTEYLNDTGETATAKLESNAGLGWQKSCELIFGTITLNPTQMAQFMEP